MNKICFSTKSNGIKKLIIFTLIILFNFNSSQLYSQITLTNATMVVEEYDTPLKPDTTKPILRQEHLPNYKQYIGLKIYLPPKNGLNTILLNTSPKIVEVNVNEPIIFKKYAEVREGLMLKNKAVDSIEYKKISTYLYNGVHVKTEYEFNTMNYTTNPKAVHLNYDKSTFDKYYTIIDVIYGQRCRDTLQKIDKLWIEALWGSSYHKRSFQKLDSTNDFYLHDCRQFFPESEFSRQVLFLLQNENGELLYCTSIIEDFISVPYFNYQVQLLKGKDIIYTSPFDLNVPTGIYEITENNNGVQEKKQKWINIHEKEVWHCENVTLVKPSYHLTYILKKEGQQALLVDLKNFKLLSKYNEEKEQLKLDAQLNKRKQIEEENKRAALKKLQDEQFMSFAIAKYGSELGSIVGKHKVKIGMNKEMCTDAWGNPFYVNKTITTNGVIEIWHYNFGNELYFNNGVLYKINKIE